MIRGLADATREAIVASITSEAATPANAEVHAVAAALRAFLDPITVLTQGERLLLSELLDRIANAR